METNTSHDLFNLDQNPFKISPATEKNANINSKGFSLLSYFEKTKDFKTKYKYFHPDSDQKVIVYLTFGPKEISPDFTFYTPLSSKGKLPFFINGKDPKHSRGDIAIWVLGFFDSIKAAEEWRKGELAERNPNSIHWDITTQKIDYPITAFPEKEISKDVYSQDYLNAMINHSEKEYQGAKKLNSKVQNVKNITFLCNEISNEILKLREKRDEMSEEKKIEFETNLIKDKVFQDFSKALMKMDENQVKNLDKIRLEEMLLFCQRDSLKQFSPKDCKYKLYICPETKRMFLCRCAQ
jgi:hypothetical protein